jgi:hypothetical protein
MNWIINHCWQLLVVLQTLIILFLLLRIGNMKKNSNPELDQIIKSKDSDVSMDQLMRDMHLSQALHKALSRKCHPDRFSATPRTELANELFQLVQKYKTEHNKLLELQKRIDTELLNSKL